MVDIIRNTFCGPLPSKSNDPFGKLELAEVAHLLRIHGNPSLYSEFCDTLQASYASAIQEQTVRLNSSALLDAESTHDSWQHFWSIKRYSSGVHCCLLVSCIGSAFANGIAESKVLAHPLALDIIDLSNKIICSHNDLCSIERETESADPMNSVLLLTKCGHDIDGATRMVVNFANVWVSRLAEIGQQLASESTSPHVDEHIPMRSALLHFWEIAWTHVSGNLTFTVMNARRYSIPTSVSMIPLSKKDALLGRSR